MLRLPVGSCRKEFKFYLFNTVIIGENVKVSGLKFRLLRLKKIIKENPLKTVFAKYTPIPGRLSQTK